jgi:hypothetical protein
VSRPNYIDEIKQRANITEVWSALGGGKLRRRRGVAWWRAGTGRNVAVSAKTGKWHDYATGDGGDVVALVSTALRCDFAAAVKWLADFTGVEATEQTPHQQREAHSKWREDLRCATYWRIAAETLAEQVLEELPPTDPERDAHTRLLRIIGLGDLSLVTEYREWRQRDPKMTWAMVRAGRISDARLQRNLARCIKGERYMDVA